ncbi:MAG: hypothetical protein LBI61_01145 [Puniceicoccales bacterium]|nr:hypothetical protein [Puniceicoccales bacterium]
MEERIRAAAIAIFGREAGELLLVNLAPMWSETGGLSREDNVGAYMICRRDGDKDCTTNSLDVLFALKLDDGAQIPSAVSSFYSRKCSKKFGDWTIFADDCGEKLLEDEELLKRIVADVQKDVDGDVVIVPSKLAMRIMSDNRDHDLAKLFKEKSSAMRMIAEMNKKAERDTEEVYFSFRWDAENTYVKFSQEFKKGSALAKALKFYPKEKGHSYGAILNGDFICEFNCWQNLLTVDLLRISEYAAAAKEDRAKCRKCCGEECCESADGNLPCCFTLDAIDGALEMAELFFKHSTGDFYFAATGGDVMCCIVGVQKHTETGKTLAESLVDLAATSDVISISERENYGAFKICDVTANTDGDPFSFQMAIGEDEAIFGLKFVDGDIDSVAALHEIIDMRGSGAVRSVTLYDGMVGSGSVNVGALARRFGILCADCPVDLSCYVSDAAITCSAVVSNSRLKMLLQDLLFSQEPSAQGEAIASGDGGKEANPETCVTKCAVSNEKQPENVKIAPAHDHRGKRRK